MKLPPLTILLFLFSQHSAANSSRRQGHTLSPSTKKPASLAGSLYLRLNFTPHGSSPSRRPRSTHSIPPSNTPILPSSRLLKLQVAPNPA